ncbi:protein phosphatase 1 regulatory subunit 14B-like [Molossus molossus]|uniref:Protein phosphatase 1 regulatory subunit 14 n=1 Tax=Molossus molossus TaxID=27622 RepID=A0A7J8IC88_MOLMO|nr:protein phosphatase 1 regulatory subunit 14B-like [Molossus molossus]KAF6481582.1 protein phosphatase 1 regulatory inhibitor subunit 14B [Molossus molossus]
MLQLPPGAPRRPRREAVRSRAHQLTEPTTRSYPAGVPEAAAAQGGAGHAHVDPAAAVADSGPAGGAALAAPTPGPGGGGPGPRVYFQSPPGAAGEGPGSADDEGPVRRQGKVTVKYDRKELRKRLNLEEWILEQLTRLYDCQEEEIPELEIDVDELLDMESDDTRAARVKELLVDCYKPTEAFISGLLDKIRGMQKLSTPQKK